MGKGIKKIVIEANSRLHLTLISMNNSSYRINGGIGFAIAKPNITISAEAGEICKITDDRQKRISICQINTLTQFIDSIKKELNLDYNISIEIDGDIISNSGFGSGTSIRLACIEALLILNNYKYDQEFLVTLSHRGGTSGIGIRTYFNGGFVLDIGHKNSRKILPSSSVKGISNSSLLLVNNNMPNWNIGICLDKKINTLSPEEEVDFFKKTVPISNVEVNKALNYVINGLYAAIKENDVKTFSAALIEIQKCAWKKAERSIYGKRLKTLERILYSCGAFAVGMSSLGPGLLFLSDNNSEVIKRIKQKTDCSSIMLLDTKTINSGRTITPC